MKHLNISGLKKISASIVLALISVSMLAQANFAGNWGLNESKSNFGDSQFRFAATVMTVVQDANNLSVESTRPGRDGSEMKSTAKYNLDGTVSENPVYNTTRKSTVTWSADKTSLTIASTMTFERDGDSREMKSSETWKLSDGGKVLMVESTMPGPDGERKTTAAYDKK